MRRSHQLGFTPTPIEAGVNTALNFIPGVGPILSSIASTVESLFSGGDQTPLWQLQKGLVAIRAQVQQLRAQLGIADDFQFSKPIDSPGVDWPAFWAAMKEGNGGHEVPKGDERKGIYTALGFFRSQAEQLQPAASDAHLLSLFGQALQSASPTAASPIMQVTPGSAAPTTTPPPSSDDPQAATGDAPPTSSSTGAPLTLASIGPPALLGFVLLAVFAIIASGQKVEEKK